MRERDRKCSHQMRGWGTRPCKQPTAQVSTYFLMMLMVLSAPVEVVARGLGLCARALAGISAAA